MESNRKYSDWKFARDILRLILREWAHNLTAVEYRAVLFVYDRTFGWNKQWETITLKQFSEGVWMRNEETGELTPYQAPISRNVTIASTAVRGLVVRGVLLKRKGGKANQYSINVDWEPDAMKIPKRLKNGDGKYIRTDIGGYIETDIDGGCSSDIQRVAKEKRNKLLTSAKADSGESADTGSGEDLSETVEAIRKRSRTRLLASRLVRENKGRNIRKDSTGWLPTQAQLPLIWRALFLEYFPDEKPSAFSKVDQKIFWRYWKDWIEARDEGEFIHYLEWVVKNWNEIRVSVLAWMKDAPHWPVIRLLNSSKLRPLFEQAYRNKERISENAKLTPEERRMKRLVEEQGMDPDKAREMMEEKEGLGAERKKLRDEAARLKAEREALEREKRELARANRRERKRTKKKPLKQSDWRDI